MLFSFHFHRKIREAPASATMNLADKDNKHRLTDGNSATLLRSLQFMLNASNQCAYAKCFRARSEGVRYAKSNNAHILWVPYTDFISTQCCYPNYAYAQ